MVHDKVRFFLVVTIVSMASIYHEWTILSRTKSTIHAKTVLDSVLGIVSERNNETSSDVMVISGDGEMVENRTGTNMDSSLSRNETKNAPLDLTNIPKSANVKFESSLRSHDDKNTTENMSMEEYERQKLEVQNNKEDNTEEVNKVEDNEGERDNPEEKNKNESIEKEHNEGNKDKENVNVQEEMNNENEASYPPGFPQVLRAGDYRSDSAYPYLSKDIWSELVDNNRTFFLRQYENGFPNMTTLKEWIASRPHPITLLMNNYMDFSFPSLVDNLKLPPEFEGILNETNLNAFYVDNLQLSPEYKMYHPKLKPLPMGPKWQFRTTWLYGESKKRQKDLYSSISSSPEETKRLFELNRTDTVWVKPTYELNIDIVARYHHKSNNALKIDNTKLCVWYKIDSMVCSPGMRPMNQSSQFNELMKHRFVASPSGMSLDTHFVWDALLAGCVPIIPRSGLSPIFEDLPVWIVDDWGEVTDEAVKEKAVEMASKPESYKWEKLFADWWKEEIYRGLPPKIDAQPSHIKMFDPLPDPDFKPTKDLEELSPIEKGNHYKIPPPEDRIGPNGKGGYIHDPNFMRKNPRQFKIINPEVSCPPPGDGLETLAGYYNLQRIRDHIAKSKEQRDKGDEKRGSKTRLMCAVYTYEKGVNRTNAIWETWGKRCDGIMFASSSSNITTGHMHMPNYSPYEHLYEGVFQKVRTMMAYLYDNFLDDFDFFHILGDDVYLIVDNLKEYLASPEVQSFESKDHKNLFITGEWLSWGRDKPEKPFYDYYMGGGAGYTISRKALKAFVEGPLQSDVRNDGMKAAEEDKIVSEMFRRHFNVTGVDARDEWGAHRYHQGSVEEVSRWPAGDRGIKTLIHKESAYNMLVRVGFPIVYQEAAISSSSVAFHRADHDMMRRYEMLLYDTGVEQCGENITIK